MIVREMVLSTLAVMMTPAAARVMRSSTRTAAPMPEMAMKLDVSFADTTSIAAVWLRPAVREEGRAVEMTSQYSVT